MHENSKLLSSSSLFRQILPWLIYGTLYHVCPSVLLTVLRSKVLWNQRKSPFSLPLFSLFFARLLFGRIWSGIIGHFRSILIKLSTRQKKVPRKFKTRNLKPNWYHDIHRGPLQIVFGTVFLNKQADKMSIVRVKSLQPGYNQRW